MAEPLVVTQAHPLENDLQGAALIEVVYLDSAGKPQRVVTNPAWCAGESVHLELRPHLVVTTQVEDDSEPDGFRFETKEVALSQVLIARISVEDPDGEPYDTLPRAQWVSGPHDRLLRLVP